MIGQCLLNLVLNATDAMEPGGHLSIRMWPAEEDVATKQFRLVVRDTGPGIPASILDRIFNPFFTTKDTGPGLGLAIVHRIVDAHDGTILASNPAEAGRSLKFESESFSRLCTLSNSKETRTSEIARLPCTIGKCTQ